MRLLIWKFNPKNYSGYLIKYQIKNRKERFFKKVLTQLVLKKLKLLLLLYGIGLLLIFKYTEIIGKY